ncbi:MAG: ParB/RepB/Spo0J family partition protein [Candidatus Caldarchaeum sp.]
MLENVMLHVSRLRRSHYNPRMVQDPERKRILVESVRREGVRQPLLVYPANDDFYEVLDGGRRLEAAREAGLEKVPCIVVEPDDIPRRSLAIHLSQDDLTPEELVTFVERLVKEEVFKNVEDVCRYLGVSRSWYYQLKKAVKLKPVRESIPVTTLAIVEKFGLPEEKKKRVLDIIAQRPLPRNVLREALREASENPDIDPAAVLEKHSSTIPQRLEENVFMASGRYTYYLTRQTNAVEFTARRGLEAVWRAVVPLEDLHVVKMLWQQA